jgi:hypothetical protein
MNFQNPNIQSFIWLDGIQNEIKYKKTAILIPCTTLNKNEIYYLQLDLASKYSFLYKSKLENICTFEIDDSSKQKFNSTETYFNLKSISLELNIFNSAILLNHFKVWDNIKRESVFHSISIKEEKIRANIIGTLGIDFFNTKILKIDFINSFIEVIHIDNIIQNNSNWRAIKRINHLILFEVTIFSKIYNFVFDTGSSMFDLIVSKNIFTDFKENYTNIKQLLINSWSKSLIFEYFITSEKISIMSIEKNNLIIYRFKEEENEPFSSFNTSNADVSGIIGCKPFLKSELYIDFNKNRALVIDKH